MEGRQCALGEACIRVSVQLSWSPDLFFQKAELETGCRLCISEVIPGSRSEATEVCAPSRCSHSLEFDSGGTSRKCAACLLEESTGELGD